MSFPIDVVYLDKFGRVLRLYHELQPFRVAAISLRTHSVLELPAGILAQTDTEVGDVIDFQPCTSKVGEETLPIPSQST